MTDSTEEVKRKIIKAYCPEGEVKDNPILDYCKQIIFEANHLIGFEDILENGFRIEREEKFGGNVSFDSFEDLQRAYEKKEIYPLDLKNAVIKYLNLLIDPVRKHFESDTKAKQLLEEVRSFQITR